MPDPSDLILTIDLFVVGEFFRVCARVGGAGVKLCAVVFFTLHWCGHGDFFEKIVTHISDLLTSRA